MGWWRNWDSLSLSFLFSPKSSAGTRGETYLGSSAGTRRGESRLNPNLNLNLNRQAERPLCRTWDGVEIEKFFIFIFLFSPIFIISSYQFTTFSFYFTTWCPLIEKLSSFHHFFISIYHFFISFYHLMPANRDAPVLTLKKKHCWSRL